MRFAEVRRVHPGRRFQTEEPSDLEYDPQLTVVAEWRPQATLFKAHVDDAATNVMLQDAKPGAALHYQRWLLPAARISEAYSVLIDSVGPVGPVPEGMSATTALRVRKYRPDRADLVARTLRQADKFQRSRGYRPPYLQPQPPGQAPALTSAFC